MWKLVSLSIANFIYSFAVTEPTFGVCVCVRAQYALCILLLSTRIERKQHALFPCSIATNYYNNDETIINKLIYILTKEKHKKMKIMCYLILYIAI